MKLKQLMAGFQLVMVGLAAVVGFCLLRVFHYISSLKIERERQPSPFSGKGMNVQVENG